MYIYISVLWTTANLSGNRSMAKVMEWILYENICIYFFLFEDTFVSLVSISPKELSRENNCIHTLIKVIDCETWEVYNMWT